MPNLILVGMMGSGKSTVGRLLADSLDVPFEDTDSLLEYRLGRSVSQLFGLFGEETFRQHETATLRSLESDDGVLATGGGIVTRDENWAEFARLGVSVFLDVDRDILVGRLEQSKRRRPLLETENWEMKLDELLKVRRPMYEKADFRVQVKDEQFEEVAGMIREVLGL